MNHHMGLHSLQSPWYECLVYPIEFNEYYTCDTLKAFVVSFKASGVQTTITYII